MTVRAADAMQPGVLTCAPQTPLRDVAAIMATHRVHFVAVVGTERHHLTWSVVTDRDLVAAAADAAAIAVAAPITSLPSITAPREPLADVARRMAADGVSHMIVVDELELRPVGVISTLDVIAAMARDPALV
jgi:CBS domain-containing protein